MLPLSLVAAFNLVFITPLRYLFGTPPLSWTYADLGAAALLIGSLAIPWKGRRQGRGSSLRCLLVILGALPWELLFGAHPSIFIPLRLLNLIQFADAPELVQRLDRLVPHIAWSNRLLLSLAGAGLLAHWVACGWIRLGGVHEASALLTYTAGLYWAITTMATVGYGDIVAQGLVQRWYAIGVMLLGVGTFGYIIGNIASLLANIDRIGAAQRAKLERIRTCATTIFPAPCRPR